jgi:carbon-monoxide dehydrogenase medium subunit
VPTPELYRTISFDQVINFDLSPRGAEGPAMKSSAFAFERPASVEQALATKARWGGAARFLAGGQSLMPAMAMRFNESECLIDLNGLDELRRIRREGELLVIGAMARHADVIASPEALQAAPVLAQAGRYLAHAAIRNRGTFGGSVALADPAAEWPAACLLLDATIRIVGLQGRREVPARKFFQGLYATDLGEDELVESVAIPAQHPQEKSCVIELARRRGDFATAAVMARARAQGGKLAALQIVFFAVADAPLHDSGLDIRLQEAFNTDGAAEIGKAAAQALAAHHLRGDLYTQARTKAHLCGVLAQRARAQLATS